MTDIPAEPRGHLNGKKPTEASGPTKDRTTDTKERQLATEIIRALNEWISLGPIENWIGTFFHEQIIRREYSKKAPRKYQPDLYLDYRLSIRDRLWMDSIILKLKAKGRDGLAEEIEQRQIKLLEKIETYDKDLKPTDLRHFPNRELCRSAARLRNALQAALPCLEGQSSEKDRQSVEAADKAKPPGKAGQGKGGRITKDEANVRARQLLKETPTWDWTARKLEKLIPCALGWIPSLPAWRAYHEKRKELRRNKTIDTVSLSRELEAVLGEGEKDEVLNQLIAEQEGEKREDARQARLYLSHQKKSKRSSQ